MSATASASACLAFNTCACAARSWASVSGDEMVATTCPAVTSSPSSTVSVASRPGYFAATSTCVASMRPFDFTMPSGMSRPRRRAMRVSTWDRNWSAGFFCVRCACAVGIRRLPPDDPPAHPPMGSAPAMKADARIMAVGWRTDIEGLLCAGGVANLSAALEAVSPSIIGRLGWRSTLRLRRCLALRWRRHSLRVRTRPFHIDEIKTDRAFACGL